MDTWEVEHAVEILTKAMDLKNQTLAETDYKQFNKINQSFWGASVYRDEERWYALDGKELRGSIDKEAGESRAQNIVSRTKHIGNQSVIIDYYDGSKESEKVSVINYFANFEKLNGSYTLDALHLSSELAGTIHQKGGIYLAQLKNNQKFLLEECKHIAQHLPARHICRTDEKGHGRMETRIGRGYVLDAASLDPRWAASGMQTLVVLERERCQIKTGKCSREKSYWVTNKELSEANFEELFQAVRGHWQVEVHHNYRDKQLKEDAMICRNKNESRFIASCITLTINMLIKQGYENMSILREELARHKKDLLPLFSRALVL